MGAVVVGGFRTVSKIITVPAPVETVLALLTSLDSPGASRAHLVGFDASSVVMAAGTRITEVRRHRGRTVRRTLVVDAVVPEGYLASGQIGGVRCRVALRARASTAGVTRIMSDLHLEGRADPVARLSRLIPGPLRDDRVFLALVGRDLVTLARSAMAIAGRAGG